MAADGPAFVAAAVKAAIAAKAPQRTVQGVAAAVAGVFAHAALAHATPKPAAQAREAAQHVPQVDPTGVPEPATLVEALRHARRAQKALKRKKGRAAKQVDHARATPTETAPEVATMAAPTGEALARPQTPPGLPTPLASSRVPSTASHRTSSWEHPFGSLPPQRDAGHDTATPAIASGSQAIPPAPSPALPRPPRERSPR